MFYRVLVIPAEVTRSGFSREFHVKTRIARGESRSCENTKIFAFFAVNI
jgi:hypothetical protein